MTALVDSWDIYDLADAELADQLELAVRLSAKDSNAEKLAVLLRREMEERGLSELLLKRIEAPPSPAKETSAPDTSAPSGLETNTVSSTVVNTNITMDSLPSAASVPVKPRRGLWDGSSSDSDSGDDAPRRMPPLMRRRAGGFVSMRCKRKRVSKQHAAPPAAPDRRAASATPSKMLPKPPVPRFGTPTPTPTATPQQQGPKKPRVLATLVSAPLPALGHTVVKAVPPKADHPPSDKLRAVSPTVTPATVNSPAATYAPFGAVATPPVASDTCVTVPASTTPTAAEVASAGASESTSVASDVVAPESSSTVETRDAAAPTETQDSMVPVSSAAEKAEPPEPNRTPFEGRQTSVDDVEGSRNPAPASLPSLRAESPSPPPETRLATQPSEQALRLADSNPCSSTRSEEKNSHETMPPSREVREVRGTSDSELALPEPPADDRFEAPSGQCRDLSSALPVPLVSTPQPAASHAPHQPAAVAAAKEVDNNDAVDTWTDPVKDDVFDTSPANFAKRFPTLASLFIDATTLQPIKPDEVLARATAVLEDVRTWRAEVKELRDLDLGERDAAIWFKVQRSRPEVYQLWSMVSEMAEDPRIVECASPTWDLWWTWRKPRPKETTWIVGQLVNHIPKTGCLTQKDQLKVHLQRLSSGRTQSAALFKVLPLTFNLPKEYVSFATAFAQLGGLWIMKTVGMSRGRGISIVSSIDDVTYSEPVVIQQYVHRPLLIGGCKFDLRLYVVVTRFGSLEAFVSQLGFARFAATTYSVDKDTFNDLTIHLTNTAISEQVVAGGKSKWSLEQLARHLEGGGVKWAAVWQSIKETVLKTLVAVEDHVPNLSCTFELFGFDVILDADLRPWVLEVNASPSMEMYGELDEDMKPQLMFDITQLVGCTQLDRLALEELLEAAVSGLKAKKKVDVASQGDWGQRLQRVYRGRLPREAGEASEVGTSFERIAPSPEYERFCKAKKACV